MNKEQEIKHVFEQKDIIIARKKAAVKHCDVVLNTLKSEESSKVEADKAGVDLTSEDLSVLSAKLVINTTNLIDSHMDCHIPNLWSKSIQEIGLFFLLQEHDMSFDKIIADSKNDGLKAYAKTIPWSQLEMNYAGNTQALIFETKIKKERNEFMFNQYRKGYVLNHSVGMRYVKIFLCIDSNEPMYSSEKTNWDKYFPQVANKDVAEEKGYFWAVTEAKVIEGSAVVKGSNFVTPVMELEAEKDNQNIEADKVTSTNEPPAGTQNKPNELSIYDFN
jgi:hypothetical protein